MEETDLLSRLQYLAFFVFLISDFQLIVYFDKKLRPALKYWHCVVFFILYLAVFILLPQLISVIVAGIILFLGVGYQIGKSHSKNK